jgi:hypothetical protein
MILKHEARACGLRQTAEKENVLFVRIEFRNGFEPGARLHHMDTDPFRHLLLGKAMLLEWGVIAEHIPNAKRGNRIADGKTTNK